MVAVTGGTEVALTANAWSPANTWVEIVSAGSAAATAFPPSRLLQAMDGSLRQGRVQFATGKLVSLYSDGRPR